MIFLKSRRESDGVSMDSGKFSETDIFCHYAKHVLKITARESNYKILQVITLLKITHIIRF